MTFKILGFVCEGQGEARTFTQLDWVRQQFRDKIGFDPYPGTLNLHVPSALTLEIVRARGGIPIEPAAGYCAAKVFRVQISQRVAAAWIIPAVAGYPDDVMELMAPVSLRDALRLKTGDIVSVQFLQND